MNKIPIHEKALLKSKLFFESYFVNQQIEKYSSYGEVQIKPQFLKMRKSGPVGDWGELEKVGNVALEACFFSF